jgi:hypothetical protein
MTIYTDYIYAIYDVTATDEQMDEIAQINGVEIVEVDDGGCLKVVANLPVKTQVVAILKRSK